VVQIFVVLTVHTSAKYTTPHILGADSTESTFCWPHGPKRLCIALFENVRTASFGIHPCQSILASELAFTMSKMKAKRCHRLKHTFIVFSNVLETTSTNLGARGEQLVKLVPTTEVSGATFAWTICSACWELTLPWCDVCEKRWSTARRTRWL
jgi:hypothetical protein